jgi:hypothetical protein
VVALASAVLLTLGCANCSSTSPTGPHLSTPTQAVASGAPAMTPGPQAHFVPVAVTATGVDRNGAPVNPTAHFAVGVPVYVVCQVRGVQSGQAHRLTIRWYSQGQLVRSPGGYTYATVTHDGPLSFSVTYLSAGQGLVKLYWDEPVGDSNEQPNDHFLAQAIAFTVQ